MGWVAARLAEQDQLRSDVSPERAAHVIWLLASFDAYDGWSPGAGEVAGG
jgi:hypothetical protein